MRIRKSVLTLALALAVMCGMMLGVKAADTLETISAYLNYGITVKYNGEAQELKDADGNQVYPITYNGTTYLPVRAIANLLGIEVNWDGPTKTVWLGEGFEATPETPAATSTSSTGQQSEPVPTKIQEEYGGLKVIPYEGADPDKQAEYYVFEGNGTPQDFEKSAQALRYYLETGELPEGYTWVYLP